MRSTSSARPARSFIKKANTTAKSFSASGRALFIFFAGLLIVSSVALVYLLNAQFLVVAPAYGGSLSEGIIGTPRFINPLLAASDADRDLSALVYSGLLKASHGGYIPDLAEKYEVSDEGRIYTFTLRSGVTFHDGTPLTSDDVVFTVTKTQDPTLKSPERANWNGVIVEAINARTVKFTLRQAYAPFVENMTLGILPKHLWENIEVEEMPFSTLNSSPIGSGPFMVRSVSRTSGVPSSYTLDAFAGYALGKPYLSSLVFRFYQNEDDIMEALKNKEIETASSVSPAALSGLDDAVVDRSSLNRIFAVFFNQNQSEVLRDKVVRQALDQAVSRETLVEYVLSGYGTPLHGPIPPATLGNTLEQPTASQAELVEKARQTLIDAGWKTGPDGVFQKTTLEKTTKTLAFSLATGNVPELRTAAEYLRKTWGEVGAQVEVHVYDQGDLSQNVIRPRRYDALLFGEVVGRELDLFAFWDSSQRVDPGLNVALYANATADKILAELRQTTDATSRKTLYQQFTAEITRDIPAVFLYAPDFVYIVPKDLQGLDLQFIETPSDRFLSAYKWYRESDFVWPIFAQTKN